MFALVMVYSSQLSYDESTLTAHCQWEDETVKERTGHPSLYAEAEKMKSLTLLTWLL